MSRDRTLIYPRRCRIAPYWIKAAAAARAPSASAGFDVRRFVHVRRALATLAAL